MAQLIEEFTVWQPGYAGATVVIHEAGTTTLADVYTDEGLTQPADNPQRLNSATVGGVACGRFAEPLYTPDSYTLSINGVEGLGIRRAPLIALSGEDASSALVTTASGTRARTLAARADDEIRVVDFGDLGVSAAQNTAAITAAIGAAAARGGGRVHMPAGSFTITTLSIPGSVLLVGAGRSATALVSQQAEDVVTITGDEGGLACLTLDGVNLVDGSVGLASVGLTRVLLIDVAIRRFDIAMRHHGGTDHKYQDLFVNSAGTGPRALGTTDDDGGAFTGLRWTGGAIENTTLGPTLELATDDAQVSQNVLTDVAFLNNVGTSGVRLTGTRFTTLQDCTWEGNDTDIEVTDGTHPDLAERHTIGLRVIGGRILDGDITLGGRCQDVVFDGVELAACNFEMSAPENQVLLKNCLEVAATVSGSETRKLARVSDINRGAVVGLTTDGTTEVAFSYTLQPGEVILLEVRATAEQINNPKDHAVYHLEQAVRRPGSTLAYDTMTAAFTVGTTIQGADSGATALIVADDNSETTGTLTLYDVEGTFLDNETITEAGDDYTGSATVNGTITDADAALLGSPVTHMTVETITGWACAIAVSAHEARVTVTGAEDDTVQWQVATQVTVFGG